MAKKKAKKLVVITDEMQTQLLSALGIKVDSWLTKVTTRDQLGVLKRALAKVCVEIHKSLTFSELVQRGINLKDLSVGSWLVVEDKGDNVLAILLKDSKPGMAYEMWLGEANSKSIGVEKIVYHLKDQFPAPVSTNGKNVLEKAKLMHAQILKALANGEQMEVSPGVHLINEPAVQQPTA